MSEKNYDIVIGIEVHVQLNTNTKIFCSCSTAHAEEPNSNICPVCAGHPGVLPVLNKAVIDYAIRAGLGTNSDITLSSEFDRKHYFYPDLPKGYQITQNRKPICTNGSVTIRLEDGTQKRIRLQRIHIEEDAGKSLHTGTNESFVDLNRAGTPLLEIVTAPDISNAYEAKAYLKALRLIVQYLGICTGNMEEGAFRADTNISVKQKGETKLGTRTELKNINSFKFIGDAIEYEAARQIQLIEEGQKIKQETRLWDTKEHKTVAMRSKEEMADYRYFQEPDLSAIVLTQEEIDAVRAQLPELHYQKFERFCTTIGLTPYEAEILVDDPLLADYFERAYAKYTSKAIVNWILRDVIEYLKNNKMTIDQCLVTPERLASLVGLLEKGTINNQAAKQIFTAVAQTGKEPAALVKELGLEQIGSSDELELIVRTIVEQNPDVITRYRAGDQKLFGFLIGEAMKATKGKGNPKLLQELFKKYL